MSRKGAKSSVPTFASSASGEVNLGVLSQLPPSTKVETVLKVEPDDEDDVNASGGGHHKYTNPFEAAADDYFADISGTIGNDFVTDLYEELNVKKEIDHDLNAASGFMAEFGAHGSSRNNFDDDSDDRDKDEDYVPPHQPSTGT